MTGRSTLREVFDTFSRTGARPAMVALHTGGVETWSYEEFGKCVEKLATGLMQAGVVRGGHVALLAKNSPAWIIACLAVIRAGGVAVPLDSQFSDKALQRVLRDCDARFVFTTTEELSRLRAVCGDCAFTPILLDAETQEPRSWRGMLADRTSTFPEPEPDQPVTLFYTSGTTGVSKGVPLTHRNIAFQLDAVAAAQLVTEEDRVLLPLPLHHVYPFVIGMLFPLSIGLPLILPRALTGPEIVRAIRDGGATSIIGVPRLYAALCSALDARIASSPRPIRLLFRTSFGVSMWMRRHLNVRAGKLLLRPVHQEFGPQLRLMASGGAPLDTDLTWKLEALGWQVAVGYGLTETSPLLTLNSPGQTKIGSVGRPVAGVEIRIDPSAVPHEPRKEAPSASKAEERTGEVLARGPSVFSGYRNLPGKTAAAFTPDGWFRTGDIGFLDRDNYLHLTGRISSLIVTEGGENIQPDDVEDAYLESPAISEIGVLQRNGRLVALIVPELSHIRADSAQALEQAIRREVEAVSARLPSYQRISDFLLTRDPLARTRLGKIRRHLLTEHYEKAEAAREGQVKTGPMPFEEMSDEDRATLEDASARQVWDLLASRYHDRRLTPGASPQLDLGIDSMEWLNLTLEIRQRAGVELSEEAIARIETVRDLLHEVSGSRTAGPQASKPFWLDEPEAGIREKDQRWLKPQSTVMRATARALYGLDRVLAHSLFHLRVNGLANLPEGQPLVFIPNHLSYLDPPVLAAALGYHRMRETYWSGWTGVMTTNPFTRLLSRLAKVVPIDPDRALLSSLSFGAAVMKRGKNLVWFPEGGLSRTGQLLPFKPGIGLLLDHFHTLTVPVVIEGTNRALPPGKILPKPGHVAVTFGAPLNPRDLAREGLGDLAPERIVNALREHVATLQHSATFSPQSNE